MKILLLEDNIDHVDLFEAHLHMSSYAKATLEVADTLTKGKELLNKNGYDILFLDLSLKDSDVQNSIKHIKDLVIYCPVVVLTSLDDRDILLESIDKGADDCFAKAELTSLKLERSIRFNIDRYNDKQALKQLNENLRKRVDEQVQHIREKDAILVQQAKLAAMGEMIGAIAHQWRQPLNSLAINIGSLEEYYNLGIIDKDFIENYVKNNTNTIQFMSKTIDDFRNFFRIDKERSTFSIKKIIEDVISLQKSIFEKYRIIIEMSIEDYTINTYENEFKQAMLNIINNAKDALIYKNVENPIIKISSSTKIDMGIISVEDNAGGIEETILERIFEPYFTTKEQSQGTGMGLYMTKTIIEQNMHGKIEVFNEKKGAKFIIMLER